MATFWGDFLQFSHVFYHKYKQKIHGLMPKFAVYVLWNLQYKSN